MALNRVLTSILENAIEAVEKQASPCIEYSVKKENETLAIRITDNGSGIDKKDLNKLFYPFYTKKRGKSGMGLTICKKLLDEMDGKVSIASTASQGTEVTINLKIYN